MGITEMTRARILTVVLSLVGIFVPGLALADIGFLQDVDLLVGGAFLHEENDLGSRQLFLSYPSSNFEFPEMLYGVNVTLEEPITAAQIRQVRNFAKTVKPLRVVELFIEVTDPLVAEQGYRVRGRLIGYGFHPGRKFDRFRTGDLTAAVFMPFE